MTDKDRYDTSGNPEAVYEPGSDDEVLRNYLGITDPEEMDGEELSLLNDLYEYVEANTDTDQPVSSADLAEWHRKWLGNVYEWAGRYRSVNMGKADFYFAAAAQIPRLMDELKTDYLDKFTPCEGMDEDQLVEAIAVVHVEFILVHPFREGNGRLSRLLAYVMALQAGAPGMDFSCWDAERERYFAAIQAGMADDYTDMKELVRRALRDARQSAGV